MSLNAVKRAGEKRFSDSLRSYLFIYFFNTFFLFLCVYVFVWFEELNTS